MINVRKTFDPLQEISVIYIPNDEKENLVSTHIEAAAECIPTKPRAKSRVPWVSIVVWKIRDKV